MVILVIAIASALKVEQGQQGVDDMVARTNDMQVDNEDAMWAEIAKADPKDIIDGDLI